jgi:hypothetical protein
VTDATRDHWHATGGVNLNLNPGRPSNPGPGSDSDGGWVTVKALAKLAAAAARSSPAVRRRVGPARDPAHCNLTAAPQPPVATQANLKRWAGPAGINVTVPLNSVTRPVLCPSSHVLKWTSRTAEKETLFRRVNGPPGRAQAQGLGRAGTSWALIVTR